MTDKSASSGRTVAESRAHGIAGPAEALAFVSAELHFDDERELGHTAVVQHHHLVCIIGGGGGL